ncbi:NUDIX domain-containing protein [Methylomonas sp. AM2-LC]|uniref:NUDIX domain-containing protein n=1 Tax=Methylomonas sp. AM2-LC TaxID=3153301 RepID=UPI0032633090
MTKEFKIIAQERIYHGFFSLDRYTITHTLFKGGWSEPVNRELFRRNNCVAVLLYDPQRDEVVLLEQFRVGAIGHPQRAWLLEIVAGAIEEGEEAPQVAYREAFEEAGCEISELQEIMQFYTTPGGCSERITLYYGRVDSSKLGGVHGLQCEGEDILVSVVKAETAFQMLENGQIDSAIPILAIQWLYIHRNRIRQSSP